VPAIKVITNIYYYPIKGYLSLPSPLPAIRFPVFGSACDEEDLAFVQIVRLRDKKNNTVTGIINNGIAGRLTGNDWAVDRKATEEYAWFGLQNNGAEDLAELRIGKPGVQGGSARMSDRPATTGRLETKFMFQTYVIAFSRRGGGEVFSGIQWGFSVKGPVGPQDSAFLYPVRALSGMSLSFINAITRWNQQVATDPVPNTQRHVEPFVNAPDN
jgi:hypothetical protein